MDEYIKRNELAEMIEKNVNLPYGEGYTGKDHELVDWCKGECIRMAHCLPFVCDVVPKSEVERLTINMDAFSLTAKRLKEENESLEIELENMRRNLGDAREGWNDAECEVERLRKALDEYEETSGLKQAKSEVAREIFEEIEKCMAHDYIPTIGVYKFTLELRIAKLKKKYTEGET